jgi:molybdopterin-guanine dinucleotide biosynthesis protein A
MGHDKALLHWQQEPATLRAQRLLQTVCTEVFLSRTPEQPLPEGWQETHVIRDQEIASGPLRGILSAFVVQPKAAWLVVACDQPLLDAQLLSELVAQRNAQTVATCWLDSDGQFPDPMCAVYEPAFVEAAAPWVALGKGCPRKVLLNASITVLPSPGAVLRDADTPEEHQELEALLSKGLPCA